MNKRFSAEHRLGTVVVLPIPRMRTMANKLSNPLTSVAVLPNFWPNASLRLCAGSVEISSTLRRCAASCTESEHDVVVLPTPPLPPQKIQRNDCCSTMFISVAGSVSASTTAAEAMGARA